MHPVVCSLDNAQINLSMAIQGTLLNNEEE
jgi:hypothetical protein